MMWSSTPPSCWQAELEARTLAGGSLIAPALILWEVSNALRSAVLSRRITKDEGERLLLAFTAMPLQLVAPPALGELSALYTLAVKHQLTTYDAAYLDLAHRLGLPLATQDEALKGAARALKVRIF
jgi:predicted nucleic acid-binding protein